jgi:hypothetical protein
VKRRTIEEIAKVARVERLDAPAPQWIVRRRRLERLASLLEAHRAPVRLFMTMECYRKKERLALRHSGSPLSVAFSDPLFRQEGLAGDTVGDGVAFFHLSMREAHGLLCDCGYGGFAQMMVPISQLVARRARSLAARWSVGELRDRLSTWLQRT